MMLEESAFPREIIPIREQESKKMKHRLRVIWCWSGKPSDWPGLVEGEVDGKGEMGGGLGGMLRWWGS